MPDRNVTPQVLRAYKAIVQHIHARGFQPGDRLPSQRELRRRLGLSNDTLSAAMTSLVEEGVLTRRPRVGTIVVDAGAHGPVPWNVGISCLPPQQGGGKFQMELAYRAQCRLVRVGCRCQLFPIHPERERGAGLFDLFPGLGHELESGGLDGLLHLTYENSDDWACARDLGVVVSGAGSWERVPCGAVVDVPEMVREALRVLSEKGRERMGLVISQEPVSGFDGHLRAFRETLGDVAQSRGEVLIAGRWAAAGGYAVGEALLARPAGRRPSALICPDDFMAMGLAATLRERGDYRPQIATIVNKQLPLLFALPVMRFELDMDELAAAAADVLLERLLNPGLPDQRLWVSPRLLTPGGEPVTAVLHDLATGD